MLRCQVCLVALSKTLMQQQYSFSQKYVRVRMRRFFDGQFKHVYIGKLSETPNCLILFARSFISGKFCLMDQLLDKKLANHQDYQLKISAKEQFHGHPLNLHRLLKIR